MEKTDTGKLKPEVQQELRNHAIRLRKSGMAYKQIGEIVGVHPTNVCKWWKAYEQGGKKAVRHKKRGRRKGDCRTLTKDQERELQREIKDRCPDQLKLPFSLWTRIAVQQLVKQLYAIQMPIRTVGGYLKRWGFTPQKPLNRARGVSTSLSFKGIGPSPSFLLYSSNLSVRRWSNQHRVLN